MAIAPISIEACRRRTWPLVWQASPLASPLQWYRAEASERRRSAAFVPRLLALIQFLNCLAAHGGNIIPIFQFLKGIEGCLDNVMRIGGAD